VDKIRLEEDLRGKVLLPYLKSIGISPSDILLEFSFKIRLPRKTTVVSSNEEDLVKHGRADILCRTPEGQNLFIIESKSRDHKLTDKDKWQGITYARLLNQIAPIVLITNGSETLLYDSISAAQIRSDDADIIKLLQGRRPTSSEDIKLRTEALEYFIGMSRSNLQLFCEDQQQLHLQELQGPIDTHKYDPDLFISRQTIISMIKDFLSSTSPFMPILGAPGSGKTNLLCDLAKRLVTEEGHLTLFYNASLMIGSIEKAIRDDFNWFFSSPEPLPQRLHHLRKAIGPNGKLIILIDAIDEWPFQNGFLEINELVKRIQRYNGEVQIIATCKPHDWSFFANLNGSPSSLLTFGYDAISFSEAPKSEDPPSVKSFLEISPFDYAEVEKAFSLYKAKFNFSGNPSPALYSKLSHPFNLRLLAKLYKGKQLPDAFNELEMIELNLNDEDSRTGGKLSILLRAVAEELLKLRTNRSLPEEAMEPQLADENLVKARANLTEVPKEAFSRQFLNRIQDRGLARLGFVQGTIQNYIIALWILNQDKIANQQLRDDLPRLLDTKAGRNALGWYAKFASDAWRKIFNEYSYGRATLFLNAYIKLATVISPPLVSDLFPEGDGDIGLVFCGRPEGSWVLYGFRRIPTGDSRVVTELEYPSNASFLTVGRTKWQSLGVPRIKGISRNFLNIKPEEIAIENYIIDVSELIKDGLLDCLHNEPLCSEAICSILAVSWNQLKRLASDLVIGNIELTEKLGPVSLILADLFIKYKKTYSYYDDELTRAKIRSGDCVSNGKTISLKFDQKEIESVDNKTIEFLRRGSGQVGGRVEVNFPLKTLERSISFLRSNSILEANHPLLVPRKETQGYFGMDILDGHIKKNTEEEMKIFLENYFSLFEDCYVSIVDFNLPGISSLILPPEHRNIDMFINISSYQDYDGSTNWELAIRECIPFNREKPKRIVTFENRLDFLEKKEGGRELRLSMTALEYYFRSIDNYHFDPQSDPRYMNYAVIRNNILKRLNRRLREIKNEFYAVAKTVIEARSGTGN